jgi:hypothetical protein
VYSFKAVATAGIVVLALAVLCSSRARKLGWVRPLIAVFALFAGYEAFELVRLAAGQVKHPPLWDFRAFWMFGQVAASHQNVYDPASYQMYRAILNPFDDPEFNTIAVNVGMPYPPPAVLLVYPLGLIANLSTAMIAWYVAIFGAIVAGTIMLWRQFFAAEGKAGLVVAALLVVSLSATRMNVALTQVTFFVLVFLLLFWRERTPWRAGLWLAPLIVLRPLFVLLAIYFVARRQWKALVSLTATSAALILISIPLLGPNALSSYILQNPTQRYPGSYFIGSQCLYKLLATRNRQVEGSFSLAAHPLYDALALLSIAAVTLICVLRAKQQRDACLALLLIIGLWVYPSTDTHYCVLLLVPMGVVWRRRTRLGLSQTAVLSIFGMQYLLLGVRDGLHTTGLLIVLDAVLFTYLAFRPAAPKVTAGPAPLGVAAFALSRR